LTIAAAELLAGTKAWDAEKGVYIPAIFNTPDVPAQGLAFNAPAVYNSLPSDLTVLYPRIFKIPPLSGTAGLATVPFTYWTEQDIGGAFFTGLSNTTTLTVNEIIYFERFPAQEDLDLIVVAKRSPEYDIKALEAYSEISQSLPVGVQFAENDWGGWFDTIAGAAQSVLSAIPHPYTQAGAALVGGARMIKDSFDQPPSDTRAGIPDAPAMNTSDQNFQRAIRQRKTKLKKTVQRAVKRDVNAEIRSMRGKPKRGGRTLPSGNRVPRGFGRNPAG